MVQPQFNGSDYLPSRDKIRLETQLERIVHLMRDKRWRTLSEICTITGDPHASVSAQLRHLRKKAFGRHSVEKKHVEHGLFKYRLILASK